MNCNKYNLSLSNSLAIVETGLALYEVDFATQKPTNLLWFWIITLPFPRYVLNDRVCVILLFKLVCITEAIQTIGIIFSEINLIPLENYYSNTQLMSNFALVTITITGLIL